MTRSTAYCAGWSGDNELVASSSEEATDISTQSMNTSSVEPIYVPSAMGTIHTDDCRSSSVFLLYPQETKEEIGKGDFLFQKMGVIVNMILFFNGVFLVLLFNIS